MAQGSSRTVLVVDDQDAFLVATRRLLAHAPDFALIAEATDAASAVTLGEELRPDVVLMDIELPDVNGIEATPRVLAVDSAARVILLSTYTNADLPDGAATSGALAYLHKEDLSAPVLRSVLDGGSPVATMFA
jgi:DNA-binding NarL/FixJ family response regulator